jgi:hypothetical protein
MPEREEADREGIRVFGEEHPRTPRLPFDPLAQACYVAPELIPADHLIRTTAFIPDPCNLGIGLARLLQKVPEQGVTPHGSPG